MNKIKFVKAEIERLVKEINLFTPNEDGKNDTYEFGRFAMASDILGVINFLERRYDDVVSNDTIKVVSSDLEEAAWTYYDKNKPLVSHELDLHKEMISFFIAGAQWQKKHLFDNRIKDYDLEEAARKIATRHSHISGDTYYANDAWFFKKGAQWQKANLWKDAQGDDLPEIDREVIVLVKSLPEHEDSLLKVSFAHRPPEYWEGKNIGTGKITRYEPKRYDKGGWNQPNVVYWLDVELPKEEE